MMEFMRYSDLPAFSSPRLATRLSWLSLARVMPSLWKMRCSRFYLRENDIISMPSMDSLRIKAGFLAISIRSTCSAHSPLESLYMPRPFFVDTRMGVSAPTYDPSSAMIPRLTPGPGVFNMSFGSLTENVLLIARPGVEGFLFIAER